MFKTTSGYEPGQGGGLGRFMKKQEIKEISFHFPLQGKSCDKFGELLTWEDRSRPGEYPLLVF
jgi:hypothetical protein